MACGGGSPSPTPTSPGYFAPGGPQRARMDDGLGNPLPPRLLEAIGYGSAHAGGAPEAHAAEGERGAARFDSIARGVSSQVAPPGLDDPLRARSGVPGEAFAPMRQDRVGHADIFGGSGFGVSAGADLHVPLDTTATAQLL